MRQPMLKLRGLPADVRVAFDKLGAAMQLRMINAAERAVQYRQGLLHRLEQQCWLRGEWRKSDETGRDAKYYSLTRAGRAQLEKELAQWERLSNAVGLVINMAEE